MLVYELMNMLEDYDPDIEVRIAVQPSWPFEHEVQDKAAEVEINGEQILYLVQGEQIGHLPKEASKNIGW